MSFVQEMAAPFFMKLKLRSPRRGWRDWVVKVTRGKTGLACARRKWLAAMVYGVWHERNARIFTNCAASPLTVLRRVESSC
ncbi:hypothetical protein Dimus_026018 [Dionaea muscipula]